jgi:hypothetical protein
VTEPQTVTVTKTQTVTTTAPATTATATTTVVQTTTHEVTVPATTSTAPTTTAPTTTAAEAGSGSGTPAWVWVLLAGLGAAVIVLAILLGRRGRNIVSDDERHRRLDHAVATWTAQGWALESETGNSAVLQRGGERMMVSVDATGQVSTHRQPDWPSQPS